MKMDFFIHIPAISEINFYTQAQISPSEISIVLACARICIHVYHYVTEKIRPPPNPNFAPNKHLPTPLVCITLLCFSPQNCIPMYEVGHARKLGNEFSIIHDAYVNLHVRSRFRGGVALMIRLRYNCGISLIQAPRSSDLPV